MCGGIPVDLAVFAESGWLTAYSTGESGRHGANVGGMGWDWGVYDRRGVPSSTQGAARSASSLLFQNTL
jgi:hypothetical protein